MSAKNHIVFNTSDIACFYKTAKVIGHTLFFYGAKRLEGQVSHDVADVRSKQHRIERLLFWRSRCGH